MLAIRKLRLAATVCQTLVMVAALAPFANAQPRLEIKLVRLICDETTEIGHDEAYYVIGGIDGEGKPISRRGPTPAEFADTDKKLVNGREEYTAWDMHDSGSVKDRRFNVAVYRGDLAEGKAASLTFVLFESDGNAIKDMLKLADEIAKQHPITLPIAHPAELALSPAVIAGVAHMAAKILPNNDDDLLGGFSIRVRNKAGSPVIESLEAGPFTDVRRSGPMIAIKLRSGTMLIRGPDLPSNMFTIRCSRDRGKYRATFAVNLVE